MSLDPLQSPDVLDVLDVLVVGGGPVGLASAIEARLQHLSVAVVEPRDGPIDKACGEGLMPSALRSLAALGVEVPGRPFVGIRYLDGRREAQARFRAGPGRGVRRTSLQAALARRADELGVERLRAQVRTVDQGRDVVTAAGRSARWLIAADGLHSGVRRGLGLQGIEESRRGPARYGLRRHFSVAPWSDYVEVHWSPQAEAYVTPIADDLVGVAVLTRAGTAYDEALQAFPALLARLRGAAPVTDVRGAGPLRQRVTSVRQGRVLLVGDAAGYVDALTGEGLATGFASARAAVHSLAAGQPQRYGPAWARETRRSRMLTTGLLALTRHERPRSLLVPVAARLPAGFAAAVDLLA